MSISTWILSSSDHPCPVCGRIEDGDCLSASDGLTVLCHSKVSTSGRIVVPADQVGDWKFTGKVSEGVVSRAVYLKAVKEAYIKPVRPRSEQVFEYPAMDGAPKARTKRVDDGKGNKTIWQEYWIDDLRLKRHWTKEKGSRWCCISERKVKQGKATAEEREIYLNAVAEIHQEIHLYRIEEALMLRDETELPVLIVEGETCCEALLELGIPATTNIGGSKKWHQYGGKAGNYVADLKDVDVVLCPDCDQVGIQHMEQVEQGFPSAQWLYANPKHDRWQSPEGGYDLKDWIDEYRAKGADNKLIKHKIMAAIESKRQSQDIPLSAPTQTPVDDGQPVHKLAADYALICQTLGDRLRFNTLKGCVELDEEVLEVESAKQELVIEHGLWLKSGKEEIADLVVKAAKRNTYNPIEDYLEQCHKTYGDDASILFRFAQRYFGQADPIYTIFVIRFLIGAVARVFEPGCKFDTALILQGGQGIRKSTFFKVLASPEWFDDSLGNVSDKDEKMKLYQTWFMEWAELETVFRRKDVSQTKAFLSSATDRLRLPYGRSVVEMRRRCVIVGTTNQDEFLNDVTGNRRFWVVPVKVPVIDTSTLAEERDRIWAAAVALYRKGEFWHLVQCEDQAAGSVAEDYQSEDVWAQPIQNWLAATASTITTANILSQGLQLEISRQDKAAQMRVSDIMRSLGWEKTQKRVNGEKLRIWSKCPNRPNLSQPQENTIDLSQSSLLQRFYTDLPQPPQPSQPGLENLKSFVDSLENKNEVEPEKALLGKVPVPVGTVGTTQSQQGLERPDQAGTGSSIRLGHDNQVSTANGKQPGLTEQGVSGLKPGTPLIILSTGEQVVLDEWDSKTKLCYVCNAAKQFTVHSPEDLSLPPQWL